MVWPSKSRGTPSSGRNLRRGASSSQSLVATSAALFNVGALLTVGPWLLAPEACVGSGGLACAAYLYGAVHVSGGGIVLLYGGYEFTRDVTIPSIFNSQH